MPESLLGARDDQTGARSEVDRAALCEAVCESQKNDAADTEAIVIAAQRPEMRFVEVKSEDQQSRAVLFRARERLVNQRTDLVNALRSCLYEYGHVVPQGIQHMGEFWKFWTSRIAICPP